MTRRGWEPDRIYLVFAGEDPDDMCGGAEDFEGQYETLAEVHEMFDPDATEGEPSHWAHVALLDDGQLTIVQIWDREKGWRDV